jgi:hypothetical protein
MEIYIKLPHGAWMRIIGKLKRAVAVSKAGRKGKRQSISYTLIGESLDSKPKIRGKPVGEFYVSSMSISKYILKIMDEKDAQGKVVVEPLDLEVYVVRVYDGSRLLERLKRIAEEMKVLRHLRKP